MKTYIVANPYHVRPGIPVIQRVDGKDFYEGDEYEPMPGGDLSRLINKGFLVEKK